jgi:hypothetical protein
MANQEHVGKKPARTLTRWGKLASIFSPRTDKKLHALIASLCVLFEDLRIEMLAQAADDLGRLDTSGKHLRELYFLRRSMATIFEFASVLEDLDGLATFHPIRASFSGRAAHIWVRSLKYFGKQRQYISRMRHNVGGHFGEHAAGLSIQNLLPDAIGRLEVAFYDRGGGAKLFFAGEIAATAVLHHVTGRTPQAKARKLMRHALVAYRHASWAVDCVTVNYLWDRFG